MLEHCRAECADIEQGGAALSKHALHSTLTKSHAQGGGSFFSEEDVGHLCNVIDVAATSEAAWALVRAGTSAPLQHLLALLRAVLPCFLVITRLYRRILPQVNYFWTDLDEICLLEELLFSSAFFSRSYKPRETSI